MQGRLEQEQKKYSGDDCADEDFKKLREQMKRIQRPLEGEDKLCKVPPQDAEKVGADADACDAFESGV
jgi:hypothetical protein